jgi:hypothetical protein
MAGTSPAMVINSSMAGSHMSAGCIPESRAFASQKAISCAKVAQSVGFNVYCIPEMIGLLLLFLNSRFRVFNSRLSERKFPITAITGIGRQAFDSHDDFWAQTAALSGKPRKFPVPREMPGILSSDCRLAGPTMGRRAVEVAGAFLEGANHAADRLAEQNFDQPL